jgi:hypothetical protein
VKSPCAIAVVPKYPAITVAVSDGAPRVELIKRVMSALEEHGVPAKQRVLFGGMAPNGYAETVAWIREWCATD